MADGFARLTRKPQCVIVHVDVGTQGLGAAVHNASCGRAPVLIFAGLSPYTIEGEMRGSRTEYIHWIQDVPDQKQIVAQYCRYTGEIKSGKNVKQMVNRALQFACSDPAGPVYLYGAREPMEEDLEPYSLQQAHWNPVEPAALSESAVKRISEALIEAKEPLLITGYSGRNHAAVPELVKLANTVKGLKVLDTGGSDMCFPADHCAWLGLRYGIDESIKTADVILVLDCGIYPFCFPILILLIKGRRSMDSDPVSPILHSTNLPRRHRCSQTSNASPLHLRPRPILCRRLHLLDTIKQLHFLFPPFRKTQHLHLLRKMGRPPAGTYSPSRNHRPCSGAKVRWYIWNRTPVLYITETGTERHNICH